MGREDRDRARVRRPARAPKSTRRVTGRPSSLDSEYGEQVERGEHGEHGERGDRVRARVGDAGRRTVELLGVASTRRAAILAVVVCALALTVAVPLRIYLSQRAEIADQLSQQQQLRAQVSQLEQQKQRLSDPEQVKAEARSRLQYVMPGETPYIVQLPGDGGTPTTQQQNSKQSPQGAWYDYLWRSVNAK